MQIHSFQLDTQGKVIRPTQPNIRSLKDANAEDEGSRAYQNLKDTLSNIAFHLDHLVTMDGSQRAVLEDQSAPESPKTPGFLRKLFDSQAESKFAAAQQSHKDYQVGGRDRAAEPGVVVTTRVDNRFGMEAEARFDPSVTEGPSLIDQLQKGFLPKGLESLKANFFLTTGRKDECLESEYEGLVAAEHLSYQKQGDIERYSYTTREYKNTIFVDGVQPAELDPSQPVTYTICANRQNGTLTFEQA